MSAKTRLKKLEDKTTSQDHSVLVVWCGSEETTEEAWEKAYGDTPKPEDRLIVFIRWFGSPEPPRRIHENDELHSSSCDCHI